MQPKIKNKDGESLYEAEIVGAAVHAQMAERFLSSGEN
jgi:hypothetical protein